MKHVFLLASFLVCSVANAEQWTLDDCIQHALTHNIDIQKNLITEETGASTLKQKKDVLWPSLTFSTSQGANYRPLQSDYRISTDNGVVTSSASKFTYTGMYNISMSWTVWNGGVNRKNIAAQKVTNDINAAATEAKTLTVQEKIAQLYVQIMYTKEAIKVNQELVKTAQAQYDRGVEMEKNGQKSKADVITLEASLANAKYNVVSAQATEKDYIRQLKAVLELDINTDFDITGNIPDDNVALAVIPSAETVYAQALTTRPEIKSAELGIQSADIALNIAKRGYYPTVSVSAGLTNSHTSTSDDSFGEQLKSNFNVNGSVNVSVPIWDQRKTRTNIETARYSQTTKKLELENAKNALSSTIEKYYIDATNNQQQFIEAQVQLKSQRASFELINEKFQNGLAEIVEVLESRDKIISAEQTLLQTKYTTILNTQLLKFYNGDKLSL